MSYNKNVYNTKRLNITEIRSCPELILKFDSNQILIFYVKSLK